MFSFSLILNNLLLMMFLKKHLINIIFGKIDLFGIIINIILFFNFWIYAFCWWDNILKNKWFIILMENYRIYNCLWKNGILFGNKGFIRYIMDSEYIKNYSKWIKGIYPNWKKEGNKTVYCGKKSNIYEKKNTIPLLGLNIFF